MEQDKHVIVMLPPGNATAGRVLARASKSRPMKIMFGIAHDVVFRYHNPKCGYKHSKNRFEHIVGLYASSEPRRPSMLEAALIDEYGRIHIALCVSDHLGKSVSCKLAAPGHHQPLPAQQQLVQLPHHGKFGESWA